MLFEDKMGTHHLDLREVDLNENNRNLTRLNYSNIRRKSYFIESYKQITKVKIMIIFYL